jgi:serine/threonine protein kinase
MASEITVDSFFDLLRQSGLVSESQCQALKANFGGAARPETARALADELVKRGVVTQWQADMLMQGKYRGFHLGPYRILRPLGHGGMSRVFLAEHEMMHRRCAIKVLPTKYQEDPDLLRRFHIEAQAIAALDHPHIVRAYDFNKDTSHGKEIHYLAMEYVEGQDLRAAVEERGPLDYRRAADFICQAAEGLAHAHAAGFVHRDIKPANLLVDPNGVLKILDLGLARCAFEGEEAWQTSEGEQSAVGTADYVAPEQVMDPRGVDGRADIYSLGLTFYFLLTGRRPFPKSTLVELLMAHRTEEPEPIEELRPDLPLELAGIIARMIAKTPIRRFQAAKDVAEAIRTWLYESESGREYSRISLLMATAMRNRPADGTQLKAELPKDVNVDLKLVEEHIPASTPGEPGQVKTSESGRIEAVLGKSDKPARRPGESSGKMAALPRAQVDLLLEALPEHDATVAVAPMPLKRTGGAGAAKNNLLWLWVGLGGLALVVLLVVLLLSVLPSGSPPAGGKQPAASSGSQATPSAPSAPGPTHREPSAKGPPPPTKTPGRKHKTDKSLVNVASQLPSNVDLKPQFDQMDLMAREQGRRKPDASALFAVAGVVEFEVGRASSSRPAPRLSPEFLVWAAKEATGLPGDPGKLYRAVFGLNALGICSDELMPVERLPNAPRQPTPAAVANAKQESQRWRVHWIKLWDVQSPLSREKMLRILRELAAGHPVACGLRWPKQFRGYQIVTVPAPKQVLDGHCVILTGYRIDAKQPGGGVFLFRNCDGPQWGETGYGEMLFAYAQRYANDALWLERESPRAEVPVVRYEAEDMPCLAKQHCSTEPQEMKIGGGLMWSHGRQLFVRAEKDGFVEIGFSVSKAGRYRLRALATASFDYGIVRAALDDTPAGGPFDLYSGRVLPAGSLELGTFELSEGQHRLRFTAVDKSSASKGFAFGLDAVDLLAPPAVSPAPAPKPHPTLVSPDSVQH